MEELQLPSDAAVTSAAETIKDYVIRTPLVEFNDTDSTKLNPVSVFLKLENLQQVGCFKIRPAANAILTRSEKELAGGVVTASAGNFAQACALLCKKKGIKLTVVVPDHAPSAKLEGIRRLNDETVVTKVPFPQWWDSMVAHSFEGAEGVFVHPVCENAVLAGNATVGREIVADLPDVDAILVPYGGGALSVGIAAAAKSARKGVKVFACEVEGQAPFQAALLEGKPVAIDRQGTFVDGIGSGRVLDEMWPLVSDVLDGSLVASVEEVASAVRDLVTLNHVVAEGAGATPVAIAKRASQGGVPELEGCKRIACVVSGGHLDASKLVEILSGRIPQPS